MNFARHQSRSLSGDDVSQVQDIIDLTSDSDDDYADALEEPAPVAAAGADQVQASNLLPHQNPFRASRLQAEAAIRQDAGPLLPGPVRGRQMYGDYILDEDFDDEMIARVMRDGASDALARPPAQSPRHSPTTVASMLNQQRKEASLENRIDCIDVVVAVFPDICRDHVAQLYTTVSQSSDRLIAHILDNSERGASYPKAKDKQKILKRKRETDEDEEAIRKYGAVDRVFRPVVRSYVRNILSMEFSNAPMIFIDAVMYEAQQHLFPAYRILEEAQRTYDPMHPPYNRIKTHRKMAPEYREENIEASIKTAETVQPERAEALRELQAARRIRRKADAKRAADRASELEEEANVAKAEREGTMSECGCCFGDYPLNRMVHCDSVGMHWFCRGCAKKSAETEIGNSKYELKCMSMDGCTSGFSADQKAQFLDETTTVALERNEQEAVLRMAGIENLASCPFCPFAAEYPPVDVNREFQCQAPDCEKVSCRLCKLESHIPKSCEESAKDNGLSVRRQIEEAMSAALIRKCNKCSTPFVKEEGCNKMTCTRNGCFNVQCYVCSKSCGYDHFDDTNRGGKSGNCPLFENVTHRHDQEVKEAERIILEKVRKEHPEYTDEDLKIKVSEKVLKDEEQKKAADPRFRLGHDPLAGFAHPGYPHRNHNGIRRRGRGEFPVAGPLEGIDDLFHENAMPMLHNVGGAAEIGGFPAARQRAIANRLGAQAAALGGFKPPARDFQDFDYVGANFNFALLHEPIQQQVGVQPPANMDDFFDGMDELGEAVAGPRPLLRRNEVLYHQAFGLPAVELAPAPAALAVKNNEAEQLLDMQHRIVDIRALRLDRIQNNPIIPIMARPQPKAPGNEAPPRVVANEHLGRFREHLAQVGVLKHEDRGDVRDRMNRARAHRILDHAERRAQRLQVIDMLKRDQQGDKAQVARAFGEGRGKAIAPDAGVKPELPVPDNELEAFGDPGSYRLNDMMYNAANLPPPGWW